MFYPQEDNDYGGGQQFNLDMNTRNNKGGQKTVQNSITSNKFEIKDKMTHEPLGVIKQRSGGSSRNLMHGEVKTVGIIKNLKSSPL